MGYKVKVIPHSGSVWYQTGFKTESDAKSWANSMEIKGPFSKAEYIVMKESELKPFRKYLAEALSEDEYMERAQYNQKIHRDMNDSLHSLQGVIEEIRNVVWYGYNKKIKDEIKDVAKYCKEIIDLSKQLKELS